VDQRGVLLRALGVCAQALGKPEQVVPLYEGLGGRQGKLALGQFYLDAGEPEKAIAQVRDLIADTDRDTALRARLLWGRALLAQDSLQMARQVLQEGLASGPGSELVAEYHFELGSATLGLQDYPAAATAFSATLKGTPRRELRAAALYYLAHSLQAVGQEEAARDRFAEVVEEYSDQRYAPEAALLLAEQEYSAGQYAKAREKYGQLFQQWPHSKEAPEALYGAAWCSLELQEEARLEQFFLRLAQEYPESPRASEGMLTLADYWYNAKDYQKAGVLYQQVIAGFPQSQEAAQAHKQLRFLGDVEADALYIQGMARYDAQDYAGAIQLLQQVIDQYPGTPSEAAARCNLGMAFQQLQQWDQALRQYEEAIALLQSRPEEQQALKFAQQNRAWIAEHILGERVVQ